MRHFHFISGLPRSGSTLLAALLRQNPRFHAAMSSPVAALMANTLQQMSGGNEYSVFYDDVKRKRILNGLIQSYYDDCRAEIIFDTNRSWCSRMGLIRSLFPSAKVIACVREMPWIIDSIERIVQENVFQPSNIFSFQTDGSVYTRADGLTSSDGLIGAPYNALKQAFYGNHADALLLLRYETLVADPAKVMDALYAFIGEPSFPHDFAHVEYDVSEYDRKAGTPGLHDVRKSVEFTPRKTLLPPDLVQRFQGGEFWLVPSLNTHQVTVV